MLGREPKDFLEEWRYKHIIGLAILINLIFFIISIIFVYFSAFGLVPSSIALFLATWSLLLNMFLLILVLHGSFRKSEVKLTIESTGKNIVMSEARKDLNSEPTYDIPNPKRQKTLAEHGALEPKVLVEKICFGTLITNLF